MPDVETFTGRGGRRVMAVKEARWREDLHPRDRLGRFIETGAEVRILGGGLATVLANVGGGRIEVRTPDGSTRVVHRNYLTVVKRPDGSAPTKDPAKAVAAPEAGIPTTPDAQHVPDVLPADNADVVRGSSDAVTQHLMANPDPRARVLASRLSDASDAYIGALLDGTPDNEADERAALLGVLDDVDQQVPDASALTSALREHAAQEPDVPPTADAPAAPEARQVPNPGGDPVAVATGDTITFTADGQEHTGNVVGFTAKGGPLVESDGQQYPLLPDASAWQHQGAPAPDQGAAPDTAQPAGAGVTEDVVAEAMRGYNQGARDFKRDTGADVPEGVELWRANVTVGGKQVGMWGTFDADTGKQAGQIMGSRKKAIDDVVQMRERQTANERRQQQNAPPSEPTPSGPEADAGTTAAAAPPAAPAEAAAPDATAVPEPATPALPGGEGNAGEAWHQRQPQNMSPDEAAYRARLGIANNPVRRGVQHSTHYLNSIKREGSRTGTGTVDDPIYVGSDVDRAAELITQGKHVRLSQPEEVATLVSKLGQMARDAEARGDQAPNFDLCQVSVLGTNLFCAENQGRARIEMPQFAGPNPIPGSPADGMERNAKGEVDIGPMFRGWLEANGISVTDETKAASHLRATQREMSGPKVVGMIESLRVGKLPPGRIFVTRDGYVVDGHHRWAANVAVDTEDNALGDVQMDVSTIDADIGSLLDLADEFTRVQGMPVAGVNSGTGAVPGDAPDTPAAPAVAAPIGPPELRFLTDEQLTAMLQSGPTSDVVEDIRDELTRRASLLADSLLGDVKQIEPQTTSLLSDAAARHGGQMEGLDFRFKTPESLTRKLRDRSIARGWSISRSSSEVNDALRYTMTLPTDNYTDAVESTLNDLFNQGMEIEWMGNAWKPGDSYQGLNAVFRAMDGEMFEVQFHTPESFDMKQNVTHTDYEIVRDPTRSLAERQAAYDRMVALQDTVPVPPFVERIAELMQLTFRPTAPDGSSYGPRTPKA